jgi:hypothetical protein
MVGLDGQGSVQDIMAKSDLNISQRCENVIFSSLEPAWRAGECKEVGRELRAASWDVDNGDCGRF